MNIDKKLINDTLWALHGVTGLLHEKIDSLQRRLENLRVKDKHKIRELEIEINRLRHCACRANEITQTYEKMLTTVTK